MTLPGNTHVVIYPKLRVVFFDNSQGDEQQKGFFCDNQGHIICPSQVNNILRNGMTPKKVSKFFKQDVTIVFMSGIKEENNIGEDAVYLHIDNKETNCVMKLLYTSIEFCIGVITRENSQSLNECLQLIPKDMQDWQKLVIKDKSIKVYK